MSNPLKTTAFILFIQFALIAFTSFVLHQAVFFSAPGPFLGWDYQAFYSAAKAWAHGADPYSVPRYPGGPPALVTPPFSIFAALPFVPLPFSIARICFFLSNIALIIWALVRFATHLNLSRAHTHLLLAIAAAYYPVYSVIERGNVDALVLASLVLVETARRPLIRAISLATAISIKVYPAVLLLALVRRRAWRLVGLSLAFVILFALLFRPYISSFAISVFQRTDRFQLNGNISPAALLEYSGLPHWDLWFVAFFASSLMVVLYRGAPSSLFLYAPWMTAFPQLVLSHSGVLFLPILALLAKQASSGRLTRSDRLLFAGFLLTTVHAVPFAFLSSSMPVISQFFYLCAPVGTTFMLLSICAGVLSENRLDIPVQAQVRFSQP